MVAGVKAGDSTFSTFLVLLGEALLGEALLGEELDLKYPSSAKYSQGLAASAVGEYTISVVDYN